MVKQSAEKRGGDCLESEAPSKKMSGSCSTVTPTTHPHTNTKFQYQTPNWGDNPSPWGLSLMELALEKFNQDWVQLVKDKPDTYAWVQFAFFGGLHISSFIRDGLWCHLNFHTKKVDVIDSEDHGPYLFFAELKRCYDKPKYEVKSVLNFGPAKYVYRARLAGCKACDRARHRDSLMHPMKGFNVGLTLQYEVPGMAETTMKTESQTEDTNEKCSTPTSTHPIIAYLTLMREQKRINELQCDFHDDYPALVYGELSDKLAQLSLECYNEAAWNNQEPKFNFINSKCCSTFRWSGEGVRWFHMNFIACSESKAEEFIFFAEVKFVYYTRVAEVVHCQILGPSSHVSPKLDGCVGCDMTSIRSEIAHPISGVKSRAQFFAR